MALTLFPLRVFLECRHFFGGDAVTGIFPVTLFKPITWSILEMRWFSRQRLWDATSDTPTPGAEAALYSLNPHMCCLYLCSNTLGSGMSSYLVRYSSYLISFPRTWHKAEHTVNPFNKRCGIRLMRETMSFTSSECDNLGQGCSSLSSPGSEPGGCEPDDRSGAPVLSPQ